MFDEYVNQILVVFLTEPVAQKNPTLLLDVYLYNSENIYIRTGQSGKSLIPFAKLVKAPFISRIRFYLQE